MKKELTIWESIFANDTLDKGLISKIYKEHIRLNTRKTKNPIKKWAMDINRNISKEDTQRGHRHMKGCSTSLAIREMQIKTLAEYHLTVVTTAIINESTNTCWQRCRENGNLVHCWWECKMVQPLWKTVLIFLRKLWNYFLTHQVHC